MRNRLYFVPASKVSEVLTWVSEDKVRDMCASGEWVSIKIGKLVLIPTIFLRMKFSQLPVEFWQELCEDIYRELDGPTSSKMRLERRINGENPSTGVKITK